jgi:hypothetical protein
MKALWTDDRRHAPYFSVTLPPQPFVFRLHILGLMAPYGANDGGCRTEPSALQTPLQLLDQGLYITQQAPRMSPQSPPP